MLACESVMSISPGWSTAIPQIHESKKIEETAAQLIAPMIRFSFCTERKIAAQRSTQHMADPTESELTDTQQLPAFDSTSRHDNEGFRAEQKRIEDMISAGVPT